MSSTYDQTGLRLICGEADKTSESTPRKPICLNILIRCSSLVKIWKADENATPETHPLDWKPSLGRQKF